MASFFTESEMGIGQHKSDEALEIHPNMIVRWALGFSGLVVLELGGILLVLLEKLK